MLVMVTMVEERGDGIRDDVRVWGVLLGELENGGKCSGDFSAVWCAGSALRLGSGGVDRWLGAGSGAQGWDLGKT